MVTSDCITIEVGMFLLDTKQTLLNLFNKATGLKVQLSDVDFVNAGVWLQNACNAKVTIRSKASSNDFTGEATLFYNRWRLDETITDGRLSGKPGDFATTEDVLKYFRDVYQLPVYDSDFYTGAIDPTAREIILTPRIDAVAWLPPHPVTVMFDPE
jgi:hypothetical protein